MNAELFAREEGNVRLLLDLLDGEPDFYVRYHAIQLLTAIGAGSTTRLAEVLQLA